VLKTVWSLEKAKKCPALCRAFFYECEVIGNSKESLQNFGTVSLRKKAGGLKTSATQNYVSFNLRS
jgi:hypothetical protein